MSICKWNWSLKTLQNSLGGGFGLFPPSLCPLPRPCRWFCETSKRWYSSYSVVKDLIIHKLVKGHMMHQMLQFWLPERGTQLKQWLETWPDKGQSSFWRCLGRQSWTIPAAFLGRYCLSLGIIRHPTHHVSWNVTFSSQKLNSWKTTKTPFFGKRPGTCF